MVRRRMVSIALATLVVLLLSAAGAGAGTIAGTVTTASGAPVGGSRVDALQVMGNGDYDLRASAFVSKSDGSYAITGLPAGTYVVRFQGNDTSMREHYDDVPNRSLATTIAVSASGTVTGIDAVLAPYPKLNGTVTSTSGTPIGGVTVTVLNGLFEASGVTTADGRYSFTVRDDQATIATYKIRFDDPLGAFLTQWYSGKSSVQSGDWLALPPGSTATVDAKLILAGFISGRVTDQDGDPIAGAAVHVSNVSGGVVQRLTTAADGTYTTAGVEAGDYYLWFGPSSLYLRAEYYDDEDGSAAADPVTVTGSATTSGIDAVLQRGGAIGGKATDASGQPVSSTKVTAYTPSGTEVGFTRTLPDGTYAIGNLPAGDYKLHFQPDTGKGIAQWYSHKGTLQTADAVSVVKGATTGGIDANLGGGASIVGTVSTSVALVDRVAVEVFDADGQLLGSTYTQPDGNYAVQGLLPGTYRVRFVPSPASGLLMEYYDNEPTLDTADPIVISGGETVTVSPTLELGKAIEGHVTRSDGHPVPQAAVVVYDASGTPVITTQTNDNGDYHAGGLLAGGRYRVRFVGPGSPVNVDYNGDIPPDAGYVESEFYDNQRTLEAATPVTVTADVTTVNASLASTGSIWGTVRTAEGAPLKGARVFLVRDDGRRAGPFLTTWRGKYRAELLRPGRWKVFFASPYTAYAGSYYDGKSKLKKAEVVTVVDHVTKTGIDAALVRQPSLLDDRVLLPTPAP